MYTLECYQRRLPGVLRYYRGKIRAELMSDNDEREGDAVSQYDDAPLSSEWGEPPLPFDERSGGTPLLDRDVERGFLYGGAITVGLSIVWFAIANLLPVEGESWFVRGASYFAPQWVSCIVALVLINLRSWKSLVNLLVDVRSEPHSGLGFILQTSLLLLSKAISLLVLVYILHGADGELLVSVLVGFTLCLFFGSFCLLLR